MSKVVLDASTVLAYLNDEPGSAEAAAVLEHGRAIIGAVNYAEVATKLISLGMPESIAAELMQALEMQVVPLDEETAWISAQLVLITKPLGLSLGDRCCLALGQRMGLSVLTADKAWAAVHSGVDVRLIR